MQEVTIMVHSDIDPSQLLDIVIGMREDLEWTIGSYGCPATIHEEEISVSVGGTLTGHALFGGEKND